MGGGQALPRGEQGVEAHTAFAHLDVSLLTQSSIQLSRILRLQATASSCIGIPHTKLIAWVDSGPVACHIEHMSELLPIIFLCTCCYMSAVVVVAAAVRISRKNDTGVSCSLNGLIKSGRSEPVLECGTPLPDLRDTVSRMQDTYPLYLSPFCDICICGRCMQGKQDARHLHLLHILIRLVLSEHPCCTVSWMRQRTVQTLSGTMHHAHSTFAGIIADGVEQQAPSA